jgi:hypothetical protein
MPQENHFPRKHGFRFSVLDAFILLGGAGMTVWLWNQAFLLWWIVPMVAGHFFLFCNVFLVWRKLELAWAACFVMIVGIHLAAGYIGWLSPLIMQTPVTLFIVWLQLRSPWYHGIFARRVNPRLNEYLNGTL